jgi:hypothetical protein
MATVSPPPSKFDPHEARSRVQSPLQKLRGAIRTYVALEGLLVVGIYVTLWFWIGLLLDYGLFKLSWLFGHPVDWVQETPRWVRGSLLAALLVGLVAMVTLKIVMRLWRDFNDPALALVLERRFPDLLGDRLITAVELSDPSEAARLGYSPAMLEQTIHEAATQVEKVPIGQVFDWKRLARRGIAIAILTVVLYPLASLLFCLDIHYNPPNANDEVTEGLIDRFSHTRASFQGDGFARFPEAAVLWFERNILLRNIIWPRQAYVELIDFPGDEMVMGRGAPDPTLHARAYRWVIIDTEANPEEGWRPLRWNDQQEILGKQLPDSVLPAAWLDEDANPMIDSIELRLANPATHKTLPGASENQLRQLLRDLTDKALERGLRPKLHMAEIPEMAFVAYQSASSKGEMTLPRQSGNDFAGPLTKIKETLRFSIRARDYQTATRQITVVPPPSLIELTRDEYRPAYRYYRVRGGKDEQLKGLKQVVRNLGVTVFGGDRSTIQIPFASDIVLTGKTDKKLAGPPVLRPASGSQSDSLIEALGAPVVGALGPDAFPYPVTLEADGVTFKVRFNRVTAKLDFMLQFTDADSVLGERRVEIEPVVDKAPEVKEFAVDVIRQVVRTTKQGDERFYMVTPVALIPFNGRISDDVGLNKVDFVYTRSKVTKQTESGPTLQMLGAIFLAPAGPGQEWLAAATVAALAKNIQPPKAEVKEVKPGEVPEDKKEWHVPLPLFQKLLDERKGDYFAIDDIKKALNVSPLTSDLLKEFTLDPNDEKSGLDLMTLSPRLQSNKDEVQPRYRLEVWVEALDNDIDTGPHRSQVTARLPFEVVSEEELLSNIGDEEGLLHKALSEIVERLNIGQAKMSEIKSLLNRQNPADIKFDNLSVRAEELDGILDKGRTAADNVRHDYDRILKELKTNRVQLPMIDRVETKICKELAISLEKDFPAARGAMDVYRAIVDRGDADLVGKTEEAKKAHDVAAQQLQALIVRLQHVLDAMEKLKSINDLIKMLAAIQEKETTESVRYKQIKKELIRKGLEDFGGKPQ